MIETELEIIKNKISEENIDIKKIERNLSKIEKKIVSLENKFNSIFNESYQNNEIVDSIDSIDSDNSDNSDNLDNILENISRLESDLIKNDSTSIENLIENYINFKMKIDSIKIKNEDFKLKIEYL